jgi:uncharacterized protein involved in exopolysaccharide biosynthesis/antitoxin (DNA-binding transcriptional repressor) of toxin-antitoxin stability system
MSASADGQPAFDVRSRSPGADEYALGAGARLGAAVRSGWRLLLVLPLLFAAVTYDFSARTPVQYRASARIFLDGSILGANSADPVRQVLTQSKLAVSTEVLGQVSRSLRLPQVTAEAHLSAEAAPNGNFFTVTGTSSTPAEAVALVTADEQAYQSLVGTQRQGVGAQVLDQLVSQRATAQAAYDAAQAQLAAKPTDGQLQARVTVLASQLRALSGQETETFTVTLPKGSLVLLAEQPQLPRSSSSPRPKRDSLLGGLSGILLAAGAMWWRSSRQPTIATTDVYPAAGVARLAELPRLTRSRWRRHPNERETLDAVFAEAALGLDLALPEAASVLLLAPCRRGDLAPEVVVGLVGALARARRVVLVDGDPGAPTLTEALERLGIGQVEPPIRLPSGLVAQTARSVLGNALFVPAQELRDPATRHYYSHLIADLSTAADLVVVVGPPPDSSLAAALLAATTGAAVIVARSDTPVARVVATRDRLSAAGLPPLGLLLDQNTDQDAWRQAPRRQPDARPSPEPPQRLHVTAEPAPAVPAYQPAPDRPAPDRPAPTPTSRPAGRAVD